MVGQGILLTKLLWLKDGKEMGNYAKERTREMKCRENANERSEMSFEG